MTEVIPEDVWKVANTCALKAGELKQDGFERWDGLVDAIARAILAERERAAAKCDTVAEQWTHNEPGASLRLVAEECAAAIRRPS